MAEINVAILGLDRTGLSLALAMQRYSQQDGRTQFHVTAYEEDNAAIRTARQSGAIKQMEGRLATAVANKDIVIITLPYDQPEAVYRAMAPALKEGAVVLDASPLITPALKLAATVLGEEQHVVGFRPLVNPDYLYDADPSSSLASADAFDNAAVLLAAPAGCIPAAVDLAANFGKVIGGRPTFIDPAEYDALSTYTETLPELTGIALFAAVAGTRGWEDIQRLTNHDFGVLTRRLHEGNPESLRQVWLADPEGLIRAIDLLMDTLAGLRDTLRSEDTYAIDAFLDDTFTQYASWYDKRHRNSWDKMPGKDVGPTQTLMGSLIGERWAKRLTGKTDAD
jgi:prephenate dehydrogenase